MEKQQKYQQLQKNCNIQKTKKKLDPVIEQRLKKLNELSNCEILSKKEKEDMARIIKLEKNRTAAAISRRKKKQYITDLERKRDCLEKDINQKQKENAYLQSLLHHQSVVPSTFEMHPVQLLTKLELPKLEKCSSEQSGLEESPSEQSPLLYPSEPPLSPIPSPSPPRIQCFITNINTNNYITVQDRNCMEKHQILINEPCLKKRRLNNTNTNKSKSLSISSDNLSNDAFILTPPPYLFDFVKDEKK